MHLTDVYLGLGGNIGDTPAILNESLQSIRSLFGVFDLRVSHFYLTTPVSSIPQNDYINAACHFKTSLKAEELLKSLKQIECSLGRVPSAFKDAPRVIDLDILLFGLESHRNNNLKIPHPRWKERLFVLVPLADLVHRLMIPDPLSLEGWRVFDILQHIQSFPPDHHERIMRLQESKESYVSSSC